MPQTVATVIDTSQTSTRLAAASDQLGKCVIVTSTAVGPAYTTGQVLSVHSSDFGTTWSEAQVLGGSAYAERNGLVSNVSVAAKSGETSGSSRMIAVWESSKQLLSGPANTTYSLHISASEDGGATWSYPSRVFTTQTDSVSHSQPHIVHGESGTWMIVFTSTTGGISFTMSTDDGSSWSDAESVGLAAQSGSFPEAAYGAGRWIVVWGAGDTSHASFTDNNGGTWSSISNFPQVDVSGANVYSAVRHLQTDSLGTWVYSHGAGVNYPPHIYGTWGYTRTSTDNGLTWSTTGPTGGAMTGSSAYDPGAGWLHAQGTDPYNNPTSNVAYTSRDATNWVEWPDLRLGSTLEASGGRRFLAAGLFIQGGSLGASTFSLRTVTTQLPLVTACDNNWPWFQ